MVNRIRSKEQTMIYNDRQYNGQKNKQWFTMTDNTMVKRIRSKEQTMIYNDRKHNGQKNKIKRTNNDLQWQKTQWSKE
jgi:hypothetical protein